MNRLILSLAKENHYNDPEQNEVMLWFALIEDNGEEAKDTIYPGIIMYNTVDRSMKFYWLSGETPSYGFSIDKIHEFMKSGEDIHNYEIYTKRN